MFECAYIAVVKHLYLIKVCADRQNFYVLSLCDWPSSGHSVMVLRPLTLLRYSVVISWSFTQTLANEEILDLLMIDVPDIVPVTIITPGNSDYKSVSTAISMEHAVRNLLFLVKQECISETPS